MKELPQVLLNDLHGIRGFDEAAFTAAHQLPPVTSVRLHPVKGAGLFEENEQVPWCSQGVYLPQRPVFTLDPAYHAGAYYVQEASSMFLAQVLETILKDRTGLRVLDLCAAPGGKSTLIASHLDAESLLISNEVIRTRASILDENMTRWGYMNTWVTSNDPRDFAKLEGYFDVIVVDAPCSGSGLFRKDARALEEWSEGNVQLCSERQQRILHDVWPALKDGGIIVYATCSYSPQEDEHLLDDFAAAHDIGTISIPLQEEWGIVATSSAKGMLGYRFFPDKLKGEGFFIAAFRKEESQSEQRPSRFKSGNDKKIQQHAAYLLTGQDYVYLKTDAENYSAIHPLHEEDLQILSKAVYMRKVGVRLGSPAGKDWLPAHDVALSINANPMLPHVNVNREQALRFLKREDMGIDDMDKGWLVIKYRSMGLGWVKSLGNRVNNYLPKHWRIRMDITDHEA